MYEIIVGRSPEDTQKFGLKGAIYLGKHYVTMGPTTALSNKIYLDVIKSHVVLIAGKRGSGKCLHGDTLITLDNGSQIKIKELQENKESIYTLDANFKIVPKKHTEFYKRTVNKLLEIRLRSGKSIKATPEHPFLTVKGWIPAEQLSLASRIATPRKMDAFGNKTIHEYEVKLLAYLIAEGHLGNGFVLFSNSDIKIIDDFKQAVSNFDSNLRVDVHSKPFCFRVSQIKKRLERLAPINEHGQFIDGPLTAHSSIRKWLETMDLYNKSSLEKFTPRCIYTAPKHQVRLFLNRLFSCDGTIYKKAGHWFVSYCSSSDQLILQIQHLLLRFGILSKIRKRIIKQKFKSNELEIYGEMVNRYLQEIGFYGVKEKRAGIALQESIQIIRNPNVDTIPREIWDIYKPQSWTMIGRKLNYAHPKAMRESMHYSTSRQKLLQIALSDESELLEKFATSDIFWDEVVSIQSLEGEFEVYDLTVPETHNFVANDIIVHNSYSQGVIAEGISDLPEEVRNNISVILLDTMGVYWTMKYPNRKEEHQLMEWELASKGLKVIIYTPKGFFKEFKDKGIPTDVPFAIKPSELDPEDWCMTFEIDINSALGVIIEKSVATLKEKGTPFDLNDMIKVIRLQEADATLKAAVENRFANALAWGVFDKEGTSIKDLAQAGTVTILDMSAYAVMPNGWRIKNLVIGLLAEKLFIERMIARKYEEYKQVHSAMHYFSEPEAMKEKMPMVWLVLDEAHEFLPSEGTTTATLPLITLLREGRQPGISLILATQQPGKIHTDVMTQSDTVIAHRVTARMDVDALGALMQSYMQKGLVEQLDILPRVAGAALVFDDTNEKLYAMKVRPRFTWHGGSAPSALDEPKKFEFS